MKDQIERFSHPKMAYYRETYHHSTRWHGENLEGKTIIAYMEQGVGDQIMFLRFLRLLGAAKIIVHANKGLERIVKEMGHEFLDKENPELPPHRFHVCSLSMPFILQKAIPVEPYVKVPTKKEIPAGFNVGIAWEGNPEHPLNDQRSCMLKYFKPLTETMHLYHLQPSVQDVKFVEGAIDIDLYGIEKFQDWYDTAELINALDYVITVDTGVLHMAGAMGKKTIALLGPNEPDSRWSQLWYPTVKFVKGSWEECIQKAMNIAKKPG